MKTIMLVFGLLLALTSHTAAAESLVAVDPAVLTLPSLTNVMTHFFPKTSDGETFVEAGWSLQDDHVRFSAWFRETTLIGFKWDKYRSEVQYEWSERTNTFPAQMLEGWKQFSKKIRDEYVVIPGTSLYAETVPMRYLARVEEFGDGVIIRTHLFVNPAGKYRLIRNDEWVGEVPTPNEEVCIGSDGQSNFFTTERKGEKFLLSAEVVGGLQEVERRRQKFAFPVAEKSATK